MSEGIGRGARLLGRVFLGAALWFVAASAASAEWSYSDDGVGLATASAGAPERDFTLRCTAVDFDAAAYANGAPETTQPGFIIVTVGVDAIGADAPRVTLGVDGRFYQLSFAADAARGVYKALTTVDSALLRALKRGERLTVRGRDPQPLVASLDGSRAAIDSLVAFCAPKPGAAPAPEPALSDDAVVDADDAPTAGGARSADAADRGVAALDDITGGAPKPNPEPRARPKPNPIVTPEPDGPAGDLAAEAPEAPEEPPAPPSPDDAELAEAGPGADEPDADAPGAEVPGLWYDPDTGAAIGAEDDAGRLEPDAYASAPDPSEKRLALLARIGEAEVLGDADYDCGPRAYMAIAGPRRLNRPLRYPFGPFVRRRLLKLVGAGRLALEADCDRPPEVITLDVYARGVLVFEGVMRAETGYAIEERGFADENAYAAPAPEPEEDYVGAPSVGGDVLAVRGLDAAETAIRDRLDERCRDAGGAYADFDDALVRIEDFNGDGALDLLVDYGAMICEDAPSALTELGAGYCGSSGCQHEIWLAGRRGFRLAYEVVAYTADIDGRDVVLDASGVACGRAPDHACAVRLRWRGDRFVAVDRE